jgi:peroxiredoxin
MLLKPPVCEFGHPAPDFTLMTPDGIAHSRDDLMGENGLLLAFICNHCPYVIDLMPRLITDMIALRAAGIGIACIMSNDYEDYPADSPERMAEFAATYGLTAPYLVDEGQHVANAYGAVCTPDFFGYHVENGLQYRGRLDNVPMRGNASGRVTELVDGMNQIAETGFGPDKQMPSIGCSLKWT